MNALVRLYIVCLSVLGAGFLLYKSLFTKIITWREVGIAYILLSIYFVVFMYLLRFTWKFFTNQNLISALYINAFIHAIMIVATFFLRAGDITITETATLLTGYFQGVFFILLDMPTAGMLLLGMLLLQIGALAQAGYKNYISLACIATIFYVAFVGLSIAVTLAGIAFVP